VKSYALPDMLYDKHTNFAHDQVYDIQPNKHKVILISVKPQAKIVDLV